MSQRDSTKPEGPVARFDVYTTMLLVSLLAIIVACVLLALEAGRYNWDFKAQGVKVSQAASTIVRPLISVF